MSSTPPPPPPEERRRPFQFSMATLMGVITLVAIGLAILFALPAWVGFFVASVISVAWVAFLAAGAFFGKPTSQTFCIGAIAAHWLAQTEFAHAFPTSFLEPNILGEVMNIVSIIMADVFAGWVCVRARRFWESRTP